MSNIVYLQLIIRYFANYSSQILELHKTSSYFESYGADYRCNQLPIINAFALTIHKVQGLSLPSVTMALNRNIFSYGQAYVGLSRCCKLEQLFLSSLDFDAIKADPEAIAEYDRLRKKAAELALQNCWILLWPWYRIPQTVIEYLLWALLHKCTLWDIICRFGKSSIVPNRQIPKFVVFVDSIFLWITVIPILCYSVLPVTVPLFSFWVAASLICATASPSPSINWHHKLLRQWHVQHHYCYSQCHRRLLILGIQIPLTALIENGKVENKKSVGIW